MDYTIVGKIINSHGIRGEVKVYPLTNDMERFSRLKKAYLGNDKLKVNLESVRYHKGFPIIKFQEFNNINEILPYKDDFIYIDDEDRITLPEDSYFIHDLIDCQVFDLSGELIGILKDVIQGPSNDIYVVKNYSNNKSHLIPAVKEFIIEVNIEDKKIIIDPIEGMIE